MPEAKAALFCIFFFFFFCWRCCFYDSSLQLLCQLEAFGSPFVRPRTLLERLFDSSFSNLSLFFSRTVIYGGNLPMHSYVGSDGISPSGGGVLGL